MPGNLNASVGVALAGLGLDGTEAELVADPAISETAHELEVHAAPGNAALKLGGRDVPPDVIALQFILICRPMHTLWRAAQRDRASADCLGARFTRCEFRPA